MRVKPSDLPWRPDRVDLVTTYGLIFFNEISPLSSVGPPPGPYAVLLSCIFLSRVNFLTSLNKYSDVPNPPDISTYYLQPEHEDGLWNSMVLTYPNFRSCLLYLSNLPCNKLNSSI